MAGVSLAKRLQRTSREWLSIEQNGLDWTGQPLTDCERRMLLTCRRQIERLLPSCRCTDCYLHRELPDEDGSDRWFCEDCIAHSCHLA